MRIKLLPEPYCPKCGGRMRLVRPKKRGAFDPFWGCVNYNTEDKCRGSRNILEDGSPEADDYEFNPWR